LTYGRSNRKRTLWLGPKSLAVLSCALALLAAQPLMASPQDSEATAIRVSNDASRDAALLPSFAKSAPAHQSFVRIDTARLSKRELHILATFEMLQRFFLFDLRPVEHAAMPAILFHSDTLAFIQNVWMPMEIRSAVAAPSWKPREQAYAQAHCLLAPPALS
jgi:hypothetical protein